MLVGAAGRASGRPPPPHNAAAASGHRRRVQPGTGHRGDRISLPPPKKIHTREYTACENKIIVLSKSLDAG